MQILSCSEHYLSDHFLPQMLEKTASVATCSQHSECLSVPVVDRELLKVASSKDNLRNSV